MGRLVFSAIFWLAVAAAAAAPAWGGVIGIALLMLGAAVSMPLTDMGVPTDLVPFAWVAVTAAIALVALCLANAGRHDAALRWSTAFVNLAGYMLSVRVTLSVTGWGL